MTNLVCIYTYTYIRGYTRYVRAERKRKGITKKGEKIG